MTKDPLVLVVAAETDLTADMVVARLGGHAVVRLDPLRMRHPVTGTLGAGPPRIEFGLAGGKVGGVYWRKPARPDQLVEPDRRWLADENTTALLGLLEVAKPSRWVNHPVANERARLKPPQLLVAAGCGFHVPPTIVTSAPEQASAFIRQHGRVVMKTLTQRHTSLVPTTMLEQGADLSGIAGVAHQLQAAVDKVADLRLTVVGALMFAARITTSSGVLDWRLAGHADLIHEAVATPPDMEKSVRAYMKRFGLSYGAFDFALDQAGVAWFLECNPNGEWGFVQAATGLDIAGALAGHLRRGL